MRARAPDRDGSTRGRGWRSSAWGNEQTSSSRERGQTSSTRGRERTSSARGYGRARPSSRERGQAFTLEAVVASIVVLGGLLFAVQVSGVAPGASTSSGQVLDQQEATAAGVLDSAVAEGSLKPTLLYWDDEAERFHGTGDEVYYTAGPPRDFGSLLNDTLRDRSRAYNVYLHYIEADGSVGRQALVRNGVPSDDAARATRTVTLYDDDQLLNPDGTPSGTSLSDASGQFYAPDAYPGEPVYNVVRVEVVVWPV